MKKRRRTKKEKSICPYYRFFFKPLAERVALDVNLYKTVYIVL